MGEGNTIEINFVDCAELCLSDEEAASKSLQAGGDEANDPENTHVVEDIHFYAMVRSVATGKFFTLPTLWSFLTLVGQIIIFSGLFVAPGGSIIGDAGRGPTWEAPDADKVTNGRKQYEVAYFTVMIISAVVLVVKIGGNSEFKDQAIMRAALRALQRRHIQSKGGFKRAFSPSSKGGFHDRVTHSMSLLGYYYWAQIWVVRAFIIIPMFVMVRPTFTPPC